MVTRSRSQLEPNDWVRYVYAKTGELLHIDEFVNQSRIGKVTPPPGGWSKPDDPRLVDY